MLFKKKNTKTKALTVSELEGNIDRSRIPQHIAIIMDGNGRWAKRRNMPRTYGHRIAVETIKDIVKEASVLGVKFLTLYSFSTENWKRPKEEVGTLMDLLVEFLVKELGELQENNVIINYIGDITALPSICQDTLIASHNKTSNNTGMVLNLALNYGGRMELKSAMVKIAEAVERQELKASDINEELISSYLYTSSMPDPELMIRTSGEERISNFLLWQIAYSELWFTDVLWPDFRKEHLLQAIIDFQKRDRRLGGIKN